MSSKIYLVFFICIVSVNLHSCKKDDPCEGVNEASAHFNFKAKIKDKWYNVTKCYYPWDLYLEVEDKTCDSVWWKIEHDSSIYREKSFRYLNWKYDTTTEVTCIVYNHKSTLCTNDDGYDTVVKSVEFVDFQQSPARGKFRGYLSNDPDKKLKDIRIDANPSWHSRLYLLDFPDTSCEYRTVYYTKYVCELVDVLIHDHHISYIYDRVWDPQRAYCDIQYRTGTDIANVADDLPRIYWSDDYKNIDIIFWQWETRKPGAKAVEVHFIGERIP